MKIDTKFKADWSFLDGVMARQSCASRGSENGPGSRVPGILGQQFLQHLFGILVCKKKMI